MRLEAHVQIITVSAHAAQNLMKCINRCGYSVADIIYAPLALSAAVLSEEEKQLGTCLIDIGAGTTEIAVFQGGVLIGTTVLLLGGYHVTNDIAAGLRTTIRDAESLKVALDLDEHASQSSLSVPLLGRDESRAVSMAELQSIARPRVEEIMEVCWQRLEIFWEMGAEILLEALCSQVGWQKQRGLPHLPKDCFLYLRE